MAALRAAFLSILLALVAAADGSEEPDGEVELDPVVVTATRSPGPAFETPATIDRVPQETIERRAYRTTPQALRDTPGVMVQETAAGQGSPFIRGFTGFRTLLLIDGIRLNNSVFRAGPNQYWNTLDAHTVARFEVVKGPASVLYGSDAVGGAVQAITKSPYGAGGRLYYRVSSAENSHVGRGELSLDRAGRTGLLLGLTGRHYGDLIAGGDVGTQPNVGYDEWDADLKLEHRLDDDTRLVLAYQHVRQNNVPRTHRTVFARSFAGTTVGTELRRDLDQERDLVYAQFHGENRDGLFETVRASLSWHAQGEVRDRLRPPDRRDVQGFDVGTLGLWLQLESPSAIGRLTYGVEYYRDDVDSFSTSNSVQGPVADDAAYDLLGLFLQSRTDLGEDLELTAGVRLNYAAADADRVADPATGLAIGLSDDWAAVVGSARLLYEAVPGRWNLFGGVSQGFRAPNLSDLTRFDSARSNEFEIPAPGLDPEFYTTFEVGAKGRRDGALVTFSAFYTDIRDQIVRVPTGATNADGEFEITKANAGDGWIYGLELAGSHEVGPQWTLFGDVAFLQGKVDTFPTSTPVTSREYVDRLMPLTAHVGARWEHSERRFWAEAQLVLADRADKLSTRDRNDTQRIPPGGTPGYAVLHLRGGWRMSDRARMSLGVENVFDKTYRVHGSGITMPGANLTLSFSLDF